MNVRMLFCAAILVPAAAAPALDADGALRMKVTPLRSFAPATLRIEVRVEPNAENRALDISADSDGYYRASRIELGGDHTQRVFTVDFRSVPGGDYQIHGALIDAAGHERGCARGQVTVVTVGGEP